MAFENISNMQKNRVYAPFITGVAILLAVVVARPMYASYNEADTELTVAKTALQTTQAEHDKLQAQAAKIADPNSELAKNVKKIAQSFDASTILETVMINPFTTASAVSTATAPRISISDITLDKGAKEPSGIYRGSVNMTIKAQSADIVSAFLDYLTTNTNFYFSLNNISLPIDTHSEQQSGEISVPVTLGLYYYP